MSGKVRPTVKKCEKCDLISRQNGIVQYRISDLWLCDPCDVKEKEAVRLRNEPTNQQVHDTSILARISSSISRVTTNLRRRKSLPNSSSVDSLIRRLSMENLQEELTSTPQNMTIPNNVSVELTADISHGDTLGNVSIHIPDTQISDTDEQSTGDQIVIPETQEDQPNHTIPVKTPKIMRKTRQSHRLRGKSPEIQLTPEDVPTTPITMNTKKKTKISKKKLKTHKPKIKSKPPKSRCSANENQVRCSMCMGWFPQPRDESYGVVIWTCDNCRRIPFMLLNLTESVEEMKNEMKVLHQTNIDLVKQLSRKIAECDSLRAENDKLKPSKIASQQSTSKRKTAFITCDKSSVDIKPHIQPDVDIITDDIHKIATDLASYKKSGIYYENIVIYPGNQASNSKKDLGKTMKTNINNIVSAAQELSENVIVSSVCPSSDSDVNGKITGINDELENICERKNTVTYVNNTLNFTYRDGSVDTCTLDGNGIELSETGMKRLIKNIECQAGITISCSTPDEPKQKRSSPNIKSQHPTKDKTSVAKPEGRYCTKTEKTVAKPKHKIPQSRKQRHGEQPNIKNKETRCFFCGESNHVKSNCKHEKKIQCRGCSKYGHKQKNCYYRAEKYDRSDECEYSYNYNY